MSDNLIKLVASKLTGPRSYFTDIDPKDPDFNETLVSRKLKLQLLTKEKIIIAASSLFHNIGFSLFSNDKGLTKTLESGIIIPAIRNQFAGPKEFFEHKKVGYSEEAEKFYISHVSHSLPWDLHENRLGLKTHYLII